MASNALDRSCAQDNFSATGSLTLSASFGADSQQGDLLVCLVNAVGTPGSSGIIYPSIAVPSTLGITWQFAGSAQCYYHLDGNPVHNTNDMVVAIYYVPNAPAVLGATQHSVTITQDGPFPAIVSAELEILAFKGSPVPNAIDSIVTGFVNESYGSPQGPTTAGNINVIAGDIVTVGQVSAGGSTLPGAGYVRFFSPNVSQTAGSSSSDLNPAAGVMSTAFANGTAYAYACIGVAFGMSLLCGVSKPLGNPYLV